MAFTALTAFHALRQVLALARETTDAAVAEWNWDDHAGAQWYGGGGGGGGGNDDDDDGDADDDGGRWCMTSMCDCYMKARTSYLNVYI